MSNINKKLLLAIQAEYQPTNEDYFLCDSSSTFKRLWSKDRNEIRDLAKSFMGIKEYEEEYDDFFFVGSGVLFVHHKGLSFENTDEKVKIRRDFLDWLIKTIDNETSETI